MLRDLPIINRTHSLSNRPRALVKMEKADANYELAGTAGATAFA